MQIALKDWRDVDLRFAVQLGIFIMLDKPLIVVVLPGRTVPDRLARVADAVVHADLDLEAGRRELADALDAAAWKQEHPDAERLAHPSNQCSNCGADFTSVAGFDYHRVGKHEYLFAEGIKMEPPREDGRRCLDASELTAKNFTQDAKGRWYSLKARQATLAHFTAARASREADSGPGDE